ncbi:MAG TPA: PhoH family protein [Methylomirabilota bacterium]|nr:PhoH family protein [Methylomirabilota bacterium]
MPHLEQLNGDTARLQFENHRFFHDLLGHQDEHLRCIEKAIGIKLSASGTSLTLAGDEAQRELASRVVIQLYSLLQNGYPVYPSDVDYAIRILSRDRSANLRDIFLDTVYISAHRRTITPKSIAQKAYIDAIRKHDIVFGIGPAGTGKTYLAMAVAVAELMKHKASRVVLTRPAVEAGEKLGFLPGDLAEKINPYLRPLYDALHDMVDYDKASKMIERGVIEVAPLAFMRGRTLNDSFVILDEAQNTTPEQMKMFLTRLGYGSKAVITGDITQIDLPTGARSGLKEAQQILRDIDGIQFVYFSEKDVVRHRLVQDIITAYERAQEERERLEEEKRELRRQRAQTRYDDRHLRPSAWSESDRAASLGADNPALLESTTGGTQSRARDGSRDASAELSLPREGQTD